MVGTALTDQIVADAIRVSPAPNSQSAEFLADAAQLLGMLKRHEAIAQKLAKIQLRATGDVVGPDCNGLAVKLADVSNA
jgi:hypothetical protein